MSVSSELSLIGMVCERGCPEIREYGGGRRLSEFCDICLYFVFVESSSDWKYFKRVRRRLEESKMLKEYLDETSCFTQKFIVFKPHLK